MASQDIVSANTMFLNCAVRKVDGSPIVGIPIRSFYLAQPSVVYCGYSDSAEVRFWSCPDTMDQRTYAVCCPEGSDWRIFLNSPIIRSQAF